MKFNRILLSACAVCALTFSLASCGSKQETKDAATEEGQTEAVAEEAKTAEAVIVLKEGETASLWFLISMPHGAAPASSLHLISMLLPKLTRIKPCSIAWMSTFIPNSLQNML